MAETGGHWQTKTGKGDPVLIPLLARGATVREAAAEAGVSERTVARRLNDPDFCREVTEARSGILAGTVEELAAGAAEAATVLRRLLHHDNPNVALGAARAILSSVVSVREHAELAGRVEGLEFFLRFLLPDGPRMDG